MAIANYHLLEGKEKLAADIALGYIEAEADEDKKEKKE
ncbi:hypothetical protein LCGC14_0774160 [marine sediment metagenome]|uniref:Uncharacterized protein n=1 Tax=marine sediment metagenome TaxID=412755 RepID=A0A0F9T4D1_9ZZZZ